jgi:hypothetical protein
MGTTIPKWMLRRLAPRALRVMKRRAVSLPAVAAHMAQLGPQAESYVAAYERAVKYAVAMRREMGEGRTAVTALQTQMQAWVPLLLRDVPGFDGSLYGEKPAVPDDVLEDGERLLSVIHEGRTAQGQPLPYRRQALEAVGPTLGAAIKEWAAAEAADREYQKVYSDLRALADGLQRELVVLRLTLLAEGGCKDKDYQKRRLSRRGRRSHGPGRVRAQARASQRHPTHQRAQQLDVPPGIAACHPEDPAAGDPRTTPDFRSFRGGAACLVGSPSQPWLFYAAAGWRRQRGTRDSVTGAFHWQGRPVSTWLRGPGLQ